MVSAGNSAAPGQKVTPPIFEVTRKKIHAKTTVVRIGQKGSQAILNRLLAYRTAVYCAYVRPEVAIKMVNSFGPHPYFSAGSSSFNLYGSVGSRTDCLGSMGVRMAGLQVTGSACRIGCHFDGDLNGW